MHRRAFVRLLAAAPLVGAIQVRPEIPALRVVTPYRSATTPGMPGPYPGRVVSIRSDTCVDTATGMANNEVVREMMARGMCTLTGASTTREAWRRFFDPSDVVGIKVNCVGHPRVVSAHEIVTEVVRQLTAIKVPLSQIYVYDRFQDQLGQVNYAPHLPAGLHIVAAERANEYLDSSAYDPAIYLEASLFVEEDTRSNLMRLVSRRLTKIINVANMKDHGATGVTGCLKNIAYGSFSNVARTHHRGRSHTYSVVGTLAAIEPLRSRTVLQIMDGLRGVWHGGPFARTPRYVFYPRQILFGTDPVAIDRLLLDIIEDKRRAHGARSIWDRSPDSLRLDGRGRDEDPDVNVIIREPGHVEYASTLGLGVYDRARIRVQELRYDVRPDAAHLAAVSLLDTRRRKPGHAGGGRYHTALRALGAHRNLAGCGVLGQLAHRNGACLARIAASSGHHGDREPGLRYTTPVGCRERVAVHERPADEIRVRRAGRKGCARRGGSVRVWCRCGHENRSRRFAQPWRDADILGTIAGR